MAFHTEVGNSKNATGNITDFIRKNRSMAIPEGLPEHSFFSLITADRPGNSRSKALYIAQWVGRNCGKQKAATDHCPMRAGPPLMFTPYPANIPCFAPSRAKQSPRNHYE